MLIDTHCHIHSADYPLDSEEVIERAHYANVMQMICVGTSVSDSNLALNFADEHEGVFATVGIHPQNINDNVDDIENILKTNSQKIVGVGEIGLDYFYGKNDREKQISLLRKQIELAIKYDLPISFHVRNAYDDFWTILDDFYQPIRGVLHCFTGTDQDVKMGLKKSFYFGINGISTFTKIESQKNMFKNLPLDKIILETDAPFLTPDPLRGKIKTNEPAYVKEIAEHASIERQVSFEKIATATTANARSLFKI